MSHCPCRRRSWRDRLTIAGVKVERVIIPRGESGNRVVVGRVTRVERASQRRPPAPGDCRRRAALSNRQVVCGAPNVAEGQKVAFAAVGARLRDGHTGEVAVLKPARIRGVESAGMVLLREGAGPVRGARGHPGAARGRARRRAAARVPRRHHLRHRGHAEPAGPHVDPGRGLGGRGPDARQGARAGAHVPGERGARGFSARHP